MNPENFEEFKKNADNHFRVAIFGSSKIEEGDDIYRRVKHLAAILGEKGIDVLNPEWTFTGKEWIHEKV